MDENKSGSANLFEEGDCRSAMSNQHTMSALSLVGRGRCTGRPPNRDMEKSF